jgi:hypothetical protein
MSEFGPGLAMAVPGWAYANRKEVQMELLALLALTLPIVLKLGRYVVLLLGLKCVPRSGEPAESTKLFEAFVKSVTS